MSPETINSQFLLECAREQWLAGNWRWLSNLCPEIYQVRSDGADLALFAAAGNLQLGNTKVARQHLSFAQKFGRDEKDLAHILIAGVHSSLGQAASLCEQPERAQNHFEKAAQFGATGSVASSSFDKNIQCNIAKDISSAAFAQPLLRPVGTAHNFYIGLEKQKSTEKFPFLLIDSKSLPRSGLHYLKNTLSKIFGDCFSFCEWYQEPGCCRQSPCSYTGFASHAQETGNIRIRLLKSHDFALDDPIYPTGEHLTRLVLLRDPLYILTSWFALEQLIRYKDILAQNGIMINKIWISHEKEVLQSAYKILDSCFEDPSKASTVNWLNEKIRYISAFLRKWLDPIHNNTPNNTKIIYYDQISMYVQELVEAYQPYAYGDISERINYSMSNEKKKFKKRDDAFEAPFLKLENYIKSNSLLFTLAAQEVIKNHPI